MLRFSSWEWVAVTHRHGAPQPEYTIRADLLNAASLLRCITAASEHRPEECRTRDLGRAKIRWRKEVWKGVKRGGDEELEKRESRPEGARLNISLREKKDGLELLFSLKLYRDVCTGFCNIQSMKRLSSLWFNLSLLFLFYRPKYLNSLSLFLSVSHLSLPV